MKTIEIEAVQKIAILHKREKEQQEKKCYIVFMLHRSENALKKFLTTGGNCGKIKLNQ